MPARSSVASEAATTDRPSRYEGVLQGIGNGVTLGWVANRSDLEARVSVCVVVDGEIVAEGVADVERPDLAALELGDNAHGFMVALPAHLQTPARHRILVLAGPERTAIPAAPSFWHKPSLDGTWSDVVFEPGGALSAHVPEPPERQRTALVAKGWLCDAEEIAARGPVAQERIERIAAALTGAADACTALGIGYVPVLIPRKRDVLTGAPAGERAWVAALSTSLRDLDHVELLDLLPVLRDAARYGAAYHRTDADWNDRGAFFAARALLKEAHKRVPALGPPALGDLRLRQVPGYRGTLAEVPKVQLIAGELTPCAHEIEAEYGVVIDPSGLRALRMPVERYLADGGCVHLRVYSAPEQDDHARLALIGDSAALALLPWIAERASRTTFFWTDGLPLDQLELELPPVVLHLMRESDLRSGPLWDERTTAEATFGSTATSAPTEPQPSGAASAEAPTKGEAPAEVPAEASRADAPSLRTDLAAEDRAAAPATEESSHANGSLPAGSRPAPELSPARDPQPVLTASASRAIRLKTWLEDPDARWPIALLGAGILGFGVLLMVLARHLGFFQDEYFWILHRRGWSANAFLENHNGHFSLVPVAIYKLLFVTVGLGHTWPYRVPAVLAHLGCVALLYVLAARRIGRTAALVPAGLLLLLGSGAEDLLWAFQIGLLGALAAFLGALLCLDREDLRGDRLAALLLFVALASDGAGVPLTLAVLVELVLTHSGRRRLWVALAPLALYALWYLGYGTSEIIASNIRKVPSYDTAIASYGFGGLFGVAESLGGALLVGAVLWFVNHLVKGRRLAPRAITAVLAVLGFWTVVALTRAQYEQPEASRYIYASGLLILLAAVTLMPRPRLTTAALVALAGIVAFAGFSNLSPLIDYARERTTVDTEVRAELGAAEIAGSAASPSFQPDVHHLPWLYEGQYLAAVRDLGSPAFSAAQIAAQGEEYREAADGVLLAAEHPALVQPSTADLRDAVPATIAHSAGVTVERAPVTGTSAGCTRLTPGPAPGFATVVLTPGQGLYMTMRGAGQLDIYVRRFAHAMPSQPLHVLQAAGAPAVLAFPRDASAAPWRLRLVPSTRTAICLL
jgi:hypothetical protein